MAKPTPKHQRQSEAAEGFDEGDQRVIAEDRQLFEKCRPEIPRRRQNKGRNLDHFDEDLPQHQERDEK